MASKDQKNSRLLFVDHAVPQYDVYAGSRTNFMYLEMLAEMGFEIAFLSENFLDLEPYTSELRQMGVEMLVGDWYRENWQQWLKENGQDIDFVFLHKPDPAVLFLAEIRRYSSAAIIYQCHDLHYLRLQRKAELEGDEAIRQEAAAYEEKENFIFSNSDVLLTFSDVEEKVIRDRFPDKPVFTVPLFFYRETAIPQADFSRRRDLVFVGACAHSPNRDAVDWFCSEVFPLIQASIPDIAVNVVGADPPQEIAALQSSSIRILGRISDAELADLYNSVRIMVVPLRFGAGVKGKVIEAMHNGLPLVSTSIGLEGIKGVGHIYPARDSAEDFAAEVVSLYQDTNRLEALSIRGAKFVEDNFSFDSTAELMKDIFDSGRQCASKRVEAGSLRQDHLQVQLQEQRHKLDELQQQLMMREQQIEEILSSTSWKLSAPVRWLKERFLDAKNRLSG